jgi:hypothetical protein
MSKAPEQFVICVSNEGYAASLEIRKVYQQIRDDEAERSDMIRVVDESGEDYLFPRVMFLPVDLSSEVREALARAS